MKTIKLAVVAAVLCMPLTYAAAPATAATASNSQAGANGHNKSMEKPTGMVRRMHRKHMKKM